MATFVVVSGGFDPIHVGHVRMIQEAATLGKVIAVVNNDNWLLAKKGFAFMPEAERKQIIEAIKGVHAVMLTNHKPGDPDRSVCNELKAIRTLHRRDKIIYCNGGDRNQGNIPEYGLCEQLGITMAFNVGGGKVQSSSDLVKKQQQRL